MTRPIDKADWSGEGALTAACLAALETIDGLDHLRVEDAPASRADAGFNFVSNEIFVHALPRVRREIIRLLGLPVWARRVREPAVGVDAIAGRLAATPGIGDADYLDDTMIQYLRTERIVPPYQTLGFKLVEMVRIYVLADRP